MKLTYILKTTIVLLIGFNLLSCSIDEVKPINELTIDNVITDEESAQQFLNGVYSKWRELIITNGLFVIDFLGDGIIPTGAILGSSTELVSNNLQTDDVFAREYYSTMYVIINHSNWLIQLMEQGNAKGISEARQNEIIAEAKFHRAMAHFFLLRLYGQFYNTSSSYGIVLHTEPSINIETLPRQTVQEAYNHILEDLIFAETNAPTMVQHSRISQTTAKALLSKVYLYMGDYQNATNKALETINNTDGYALESNYADIFFNRFNSIETFFSPYIDTEDEFAFYPVDRTRQSFSLEQLADEQVDGPGSLFGQGEGFDFRYSYAYSEATQGFNLNGKYPHPEFPIPGFEITGNAPFFLRMGEIYLIYAEAKARLAPGDNADTDAVTRLNEIRGRAGVDPVNPNNKAELLMAIFNEKKLELFAEAGERWFDIVRFDRLNDISASTLKSTLTNADKLILPIPRNAIVGNPELKQNPGY